MPWRDVASIAALHESARKCLVRKTALPFASADIRRGAECPSESSQSLIGFERKRFSPVSIARLPESQRASPGRSPPCASETSREQVVNVSAGGLPDVSTTTFFSPSIPFSAYTFLPRLPAGSRSLRRSSPCQSVLVAWATQLMSGYYGIATETGHATGCAAQRGCSIRLLLRRVAGYSPVFRKEFEHDPAQHELRLPTSRNSCTGIWKS